MLQIYIHNDLQSGWLDIPTDGVLSLEALQPAFDEDYSTGEYTLPVSIPWTAKNRMILSYSERLENLRSRQYYWRCDVYENGWPEISNGKITLLEKNGNRDYLSGTFSVSIAGTKGLFGSKIKNKMLRDINLDADIDWTASADSSREWATKVMKGTITDYPFIAFAPVVNQNFFDEDVNDYNGESLGRDTLNDIVINSGAWTFDRVNPDDITAAMVAGTEEYTNYRTVPFLRLKYVLTQLFATFGFAVNGDMIDDVEWDKLYLFNNCGIEKYNTAIHSDENKTIQLRNHLPKMKVSDFLKGIFTFFNLYPTFPTLNTVTLRYRQRNFTDKKIYSLNGKADMAFSSTLADTSDIQGYKIDYTWDNDGYYGDIVKNDLTEKIDCGTVATSDKLTTIAAQPDGSALNTNCIAFVEAENLYYQVIDAASASVATWEAFAEDLCPFIKVDGTIYGPTDTEPDDTGNSIDLKVATLAQYIENDTTNNVSLRRNKLATSSVGTWFTPKGKKVEGADYGIKLMYIDKIANDDGDIVPQSYNHNKNKSGADIATYSLALRAKNGLATLHEKWQDFRLSPEVVKVDVLADKLTIEGIDQATILEMNNVQFLPYQINRDIPNAGTMEVQMVPI